jgi:hypothetical protein
MPEPLLSAVWRKELHRSLLNPTMRLTSPDRVFWESPHLVLRDLRASESEPVPEPDGRPVQEILLGLRDEVRRFRCALAAATDYYLKWPTATRSLCGDMRTRLDTDGVEAAKVVVAGATSRVMDLWESPLPSFLRTSSRARSAAAKKPVMTRLHAFDVLIGQCLTPDETRLMREEARRTLLLAVRLLAQAPVFLTGDSSDRRRHNAEDAIYQDLHAARSASGHNPVQAGHDREGYRAILRFMRRLLLLPLMQTVLSTSETPNPLHLHKAFGLGGYDWPDKAGRPFFPVDRSLVQFLRAEGMHLYARLRSLNLDDSRLSYVDLPQLLRIVCYALDTIRLRRSLVLSMYPESQDIKALFFVEAEGPAARHLSSVAAAGGEGGFKAVPAMVDDMQRFLRLVQNGTATAPVLHYLRHGYPTSKDVLTRLLVKPAGDLHSFYRRLHESPGAAETVGRISIWPRSQDCLSMCRQAVELLRQNGWEFDVNCGAICKEGIAGDTDADAALSLLARPAIQQAACAEATSSSPENVGLQLNCTSSTFLSDVSRLMQESGSFSKSDYVKHMEDRLVGKDACALQMRKVCNGNIDMPCLENNSHALGAACNWKRNQTVCRFLASKNTPFYKQISDRLGCNVASMTDASWDVMRTVGFSPDQVRVHVSSFMSKPDWDRNHFSRVVHIALTGGTVNFAIDSALVPALARHRNHKDEVYQEFKAAFVDSTKDDFKAVELREFLSGRKEYERWFSSACAAHVAGVDAQDLENFYYHVHLGSSGRPQPFKEVLIAAAIGAGVPFADDRPEASEETCELYKLATWLVQYIASNDNFNAWLDKPMMHPRPSKQMEYSIWGNVAAHARNRLVEKLAGSYQQFPRSVVAMAAIMTESRSRLTAQVFQEIFTELHHSHAAKLFLDYSIGERSDVQENEASVIKNLEIFWDHLLAFQVRHYQLERESKLVTDKLIGRSTDIKYKSKAVNLISWPGVDLKAMFRLMLPDTAFT